MFSAKLSALHYRPEMTEEEEKQWQDAGFPGLQNSTENLTAQGINTVDALDAMYKRYDRPISQLVLFCLISTSIWPSYFICTCVKMKV